jgi:serine protease
MPQPRSVALLVVSLLAACGKGDGGGRRASSTGFTLAGTVTAASAQVVDGDTNDPLQGSQPNDDGTHAQQVPSAVTIGGWASAAADPVDAYRARLAAGQRVTLAIAGAAPGEEPPDLDLCLYDVLDETTPVDCSAGAGQVEALDVSKGGEYFVMVTAVQGASGYTLTLGIAGASQPALRVRAEFVPGEVVVRFKDGGVGKSAARGAAGPPAAGGGLAAKASALGVVPLAGEPGRPVLLGLGGGEAARRQALAALGAARPLPGPSGPPMDPIAAEKWETLQAVKALRARPDVESADPNYVLHAMDTPTDPLFPYQWHYPFIRLPQAWDVPGTDGRVVVAVADTGVFLAHPDLQAQLVPGYDFISDAARARDDDGIDPNADDPGDQAAAGASSWHGTHIAGTIAAGTNNGQGVAGVGRGARVMPIRVLGVGGGTSYDLIQGALYAAGLPNDSKTVPAEADRASILNLSLGCLDCFSATEQAAFAEVRNAGVTIVAAAGNENTDAPSYPASYPGVVSVSAVDMASARAPYSNLGPNVDVAAPGGNTGADLDGNGYGDGILSTIVDDRNGTREPAWAFYQGTSMAAPHVAGVVALMKAVCPSLTPAQLDDLLSSGTITDDLGDAGRDDVFGHGLIDAVAAVQGAQQACGQPPAPALEVTPTNLDFGSAEEALELTLARTGEGALRLAEGDPAVADVPWLAVTPLAVDPDTGLGTWGATVDRAGLHDGRYAGSITFNVQGGWSVVVPVKLQVGAPAGPGDLGYLYVLLVDEGVGAVAQAEGRGTSGSYAFSFAGVGAGAYLVVAGTDLDGDGDICDDGEACGAWPTLGAPAPLEVDADRFGLDFTAAFIVDLAGAARPQGEAGYRLRGAP